MSWPAYANNVIVAGPPSSHIDNTTVVKGAISAGAPANAPAKEVVAAFEYLGQNVEIYRTERPGLYRDPQGRDWINVDPRSNNEYILVEHATPELILRALHLSQSDVAGVVRDHRGDEFIQVEEEGKRKFIRLSSATPEEILKTFASFDFKGIPRESLRVYPREQIKFSSALFLVQMAHCFGGMGNGVLFSASNSTPSCVDDFIAHLLDWKGAVGFYFFIMANRATSQALLKVSMITAAHIGKKDSIPMLRQKLAPFYGYLGMAAGSLASQVVVHFLSAPTWKQCFEQMSEEGLANPACKQAYTHFLSIEGFWDDFAASSMSMIASSIAAMYTQKRIVNGFNMAQRGLKVVGGNLKAIEAVSRNGSKVIQAIRWSKNLVVVSGVPGLLMFVTTEIGHFVLFLAWEEVLRAPFSRGYHDLTKSSAVKDGIASITSGADESKKLNWETPYLIKECNNNARARLCTNRVPLLEGLSELQFGAKKYREKVLLNNFEVETSNWSKKVLSYLNSYNAGKMVLEHVYRARKEVSNTSLNLRLTTEVLVQKWAAAAITDIPQDNDFKKALLPRLKKLIEKTAGFPPTKAQITPVRPPFTKYPITTSLDITSTLKMSELRKELTEFKTWVKSAVYGAGAPARTLDCQTQSQICGALFATNRIKLDALPDGLNTYVYPSNRDFLLNLVSIYGMETVQKTFFQMMCQPNTDFDISGTDDSGLSASISMPRMLDLPDAEFRTFQHENCKDIRHQSVHTLTIEDLSDLWILKGRAYPSPLALMMDQSVKLTSGADATDALAWWNRGAFLKTSEFIRNATINYQKLLADNFLKMIPRMSAEELVAMARPQQRGPELEHHISTPQLNMWERPPLSLSILGHATFLLDTVKWKVANDQAVNTAIEKTKLALAEFTIGLNDPPDESSIHTAWTDLDQHIQSTGSNEKALKEAHKRFLRKIQEIGMSEGKLKRIMDGRKAVMTSLKELYLALTGEDYDKMSPMAKTRNEKNLSAAELSKLSKTDYKNYILFKLTHESIHNIVIEIDNLYDKIGLKPLTGMPLVGGD